MIGEWTLANISEDDLLLCLDQLTEAGHDQAILFVAYSEDRHMMYHLVCTDPDGKWFWLNDPKDTGWTKVKRNPLANLPLDIRNRTITLVIAR